MEHGEEPLSARPALETEGLRFLHVTGEGRRGVRRAPPCSVGRPPGGLALTPRAGRDSGLGPSAASSKSPWLGGRSRTPFAGILFTSSFCSDRSPPAGVSLCTALTHLLSPFQSVAPGVWRAFAFLIRMDTRPPSPSEPSCCALHPPDFPPTSEFSGG